MEQIAGFVKSIGLPKATLLALISTGLLLLLETLTFLNATVSWGFYNLISGLAHASQVLFFYVLFLKQTKGE